MDAVAPVASWPCAPAPQHSNEVSANMRHACPPCPVMYCVCVPGPRSRSVSWASGTSAGWSPTNCPPAPPVSRSPSAETAPQHTVAPRASQAHHASLPTALSPCTAVS
eukprot:2385261-Rhodomonas_salina.1